MPLLKPSTNPPLTHRTFEPWRAGLNRRRNATCSDLLLFEREQDVCIQLPGFGRSSAAPFRPVNPIFVSVLGVCLLTLGINLASALPSDVQLIALVPPGSELVAEIRAPSPHRHTGNFSFMTSYNRVDLADFVALTGCDQSRVLNEVIFTASPGRDGNPIEHSILVGGHFDQDHIFRNVNSKETTFRYRGEVVLDVSPYERERSYFNHRRWLAFMGSSIAVFGTVASVKTEIDRSLAGSPPDRIILQRLARLQHRDEEWSLLPAVGQGTAVGRQLRLLDSTLAALAENGDFVAFGIRFGRRVDLEFAVGRDSNVETASLPESLSVRSADLHNHGSLLRSQSGRSSAGDALEHRFFRLSKTQFEKWVAQASSTAHEVLSSALEGSTPD
jgi:hypothetical protein